MKTRLNGFFNYVKIIGEKVVVVLEEIMKDKKIAEIRQILIQFHLPRWEELPDFDLYMDQVVTLVNQTLSPLLPTSAVLTSSMVNNYVKQKLLPPPTKKRYTKEHLAFLIVISLLKQVMSLPDIKKAIVYQLQLETRREAYERYCQLQEQALNEMAQQLISHESGALKFDGKKEKSIFLRSLTLSLALKIYSEIILTIDAKGEQRDE